MSHSISTDCTKLNKRHLGRADGTASHSKFIPKPYSRTRHEECEDRPGHMARLYSRQTPQKLRASYTIMDLSSAASLSCNQHNRWSIMQGVLPSARTHGRATDAFQSLRPVDRILESQGRADQPKSVPNDDPERHKEVGGWERHVRMVILPAADWWLF